MTSEAIEESGVKVFMSALVLGSGTTARWRFESKPEGAYEPSDIGMLKPGRRTAMLRLHNEPVYYSFTMLPAQCGGGLRLRFCPSVCGTHHRASGGPAPARRSNALDPSTLS